MSHPYPLCLICGWAPVPKDTLLTFKKEGRSFSLDKSHRPGQNQIRQFTSTHGAEERNQAAQSAMKQYCTTSGFCRVLPPKVSNELGPYFVNHNMVQDKRGPSVSLRLSPLRKRKKVLNKSRRGRSTLKPTEEKQTRIHFSNWKDPTALKTGFSDRLTINCQVALGLVGLSVDCFAGRRCG